LLPTPKEVEVLRLAHAIVTVHLFSETTIIWFKDHFVISQQF
jgi:hypothetical protein